MEMGNQEWKSGITKEMGREMQKLKESFESHNLESSGSSKVLLTNERESHFYRLIQETRRT
jgi:hypothetical protein